MYPVYTLPPWLADEQQLRDEAVLFGLSEARPDEKIAAIRLAFAALTAPLEKQIEQHHEAIGNLNLLLETAHNQPVTYPDSEVRFGNWPVGQFLVGLLGSLLGCAGTYLGTLALIHSETVALLAAGLAGLGGGIATFMVSQAIYRNRLAISTSDRNEWHETRRQQMTTEDDWSHQKRQEIARLYDAEATLNQQNAYRDCLIRLFESEFDLARSLRHQVRDRFIDA